MSAKSLGKLILITLLFSLGKNTFAQDASRVFVEQTGWSIGWNLGTTDMWGDVGTKNPIEHYINGKYFDKVVAMGGMFGRYTIHPALAVRMGASYGTLYATDAWNERLMKLDKLIGGDAYQRWARQQDSKPDVFENTLLLEFTPFRLNAEKRRAGAAGQLYFGLGISYFYFIPKSSVGQSGVFVNTYDYHLEGEGFGDSFPKQYSRWAFAIPMVVGYRFDLGKHINLGFEFNFRKTFTDHLDGVSGKYITYDEYKKHLSAEDAWTAFQVADKSPFWRTDHPHTHGENRGTGTGSDNYSSFNIVLYYKLHQTDQRWWTRM